MGSGCTIKIEKRGKECRLIGGFSNNGLSPYNDREIAKLPSEVIPPTALNGIVISTNFLGVLIIYTDGRLVLRAMLNALSSNGQNTGYSIEYFVD